MLQSEVQVLFSRYRRLVFRRARFLLGHREDAEEATQDIFLRVWQYAETFEHRSQILTWLMRITTNFCLNTQRNRRVRRDLWKRYLQVQMEIRQVPSPDARLLVKAALAQVDEVCVDAVLSVLVGGMTHGEAAELLGVSRQTVAHLLERFRKSATRLLGG